MIFLLYHEQFSWILWASLSSIIKWLKYLPHREGCFKNKNKIIYVNAYCISRHMVGTPQIVDIILWDSIVGRMRQITSTLWDWVQKIKNGLSYSRYEINEILCKTSIYLASNTLQLFHCYNYYDYY